MKAKTGILSRAFLALVSITLALSCTFLDPGMGTLTITVPDHVLGVSSDASVVQPRAAAPGGDETRRFVRVYLEANGTIVPLAGRAVYEAEIGSGGKLEIDGVAPVRNANIYLSISAASGADFRAFRYAKNKAAFTVTAGAATAVAMESAYSPFTDLSLRNDTVNGVRHLKVGAVDYTLAGGKLYWGLGEAARELTVPGALGLSAGKILEGPNPSADQLWINTDSGIRPLLPDGVLGEEITGIAAKRPGGNPISDQRILESGIVVLSDETYTMTAAYYQRPGSIGFAFHDSDKGWVWVDLYDVFDPDSEYYAGSVGDLKALIEGNTGRLVRDLFVSDTGKFGYAISSIGSFRLGTDLKKKSETLKENPTFAEIQAAFLTGNTLSVNVGTDKQFLIQSLSHAGDTLFIGTDRGVFSQATASSEVPGALVGSVSLLTLPRVVNVVKVRAQNVAAAGKAGVWAAVLGKKGSLYLLKDGAFVKEYRFYMGLPEFGGDPERKGDIYWTGAGLVVTGTNGAVLLSNGSLGD